MTPNSGIVLPKTLTDLVAQRGRIWVDHDAATRAQAQLEKFALEVIAGEATETLDPLSSSGEPPDEVTVAVKALGREIDAVKGLRNELKTAEHNRLVGITLAVVGVILVIVVFVVITRMH